MTCRRLPCAFCLLPLALILLAGCAKLVPAEGVLTLNGQPLDGATLTFIPTDAKKGPDLIGPTVQGGKFEMYTKDKPGVMPGKYKVTVSKMDVRIKKGTVESVTELAPRDYLDPSKTPLEVDIPSSGKTDIQLDVKGELTPEKN